jgi:hypothetical protein
MNRILYTWFLMILFSMPGLSTVHAQLYKSLYDSSTHYKQLHQYAKELYFAKLMYEEVLKNPKIEKEKKLIYLDQLANANLDVLNYKELITNYTEREQIARNAKDKIQLFGSRIALFGAYQQVNDLYHSDSLMNELVKNYSSNKKYHYIIETLLLKYYLDTGKKAMADSIFGENGNLFYVYENSDWDRIITEFQYCRKHQDYFLIDDYMALLSADDKISEKNKEKIFLTLLEELVDVSMYIGTKDKNDYKNYPNLDLYFLFSKYQKLKKTDYFKDDSLSYDFDLLFGETFVHIGDYRKADSIFKACIFQSVNSYGVNNHFHCYAIGKLAYMNEQLGRFNIAQNYYEKNIQLAAEVYGENSGAYAFVLQDLSTFYVQMGKYDDLKKILLNTIALAEKHLGKLSNLYASLLYINSNLSKHENDYSGSIQQLEEAIRINEENGIECNPCFSNLLVALANVYEQSGKYPEAEASYIRTIRFLDDNMTDATADPYYIKFLTDLANFYVRMNAGNQSSSLHNFVNAYKGEYTYARESLGFIYDQAINYYTQRFSEKHFKVAETHYHKALYYWSFEKDDPSFSNYNTYAEFNKSISVLMEHIQHNFPYMSEKEKTDFYYSTDEIFNSYYAFIITRNLKSFSYQTVDTWEKIKKTLGSDSLYFKTQGIKINSNSYYTISDVHQSALYNLRLQTKSIILNSIKDITAIVQNSNDSILLKQYQQLHENRELYTKSLMNVSNKNTLDSLSIIIKLLERELSGRSELYRNKQSENNYTWKDIQNKLNADETAIEMIRIAHPKYYLTGSNSYKDSSYYIALIVDKTTIEKPGMIIYNNGQQMDTRYYRYYINCIKGKLRDTISFKNYWSTIHNDYLYNKNKVYLSADGIFNLINPATFLNKNKYMADQYQVNFVTSTKEVINFSTDRSSNSENFIIGSPDFKNKERDTKNEERSAFSDEIDRSEIAPLPGTKTETDFIADLLKKNNLPVTKLQNTDANEHNLKSLTNVKLLHIATHGFFINNPTKFESPLLRCGLILSNYTPENADREDGIFTASEAMNLDLNKTELVILSACETGLGAIRNGEGVYGLQRAFKEAGANTILMSLWKVNDNSTMEFMKAFYSSWIVDNNSTKAFYLAQKQIRLKFPDPYYWGAFIIVGN